MAKESGAEILAGCGTALVAMPFMIAVNALAIKYGWNSVVVPTFAAVAINGYQAFGLSVITHYLTYQGTDDSKEEEKKKKPFLETVILSIINGFARPALFMLSIWILLQIAGAEIGPVPIK